MRRPLQSLSPAGIHNELGRDRMGPASAKVTVDPSLDAFHPRSLKDLSPMEQDPLLQIAAESNQIQFGSAIFRQDPTIAGERERLGAGIPIQPTAGRAHVTAPSVFLPQGIGIPVCGIIKNVPTAKIAFASDLCYDMLHLLHSRRGETVP
jgi:hypothetical protein